jgi:hypothetical protein
VKIATDKYDEADVTPYAPIVQEDIEDHGKDTQPIADDSTSTTANDQSGVSIRTSNWTTPPSKAIQHLELWHQRLGHAAPRTMKRTQQVVDDILQLPDTNPLFCCPFGTKQRCGKATAANAPHAKPSSQEPPSIWT